MIFNHLRRGLSGVMGNYHAPFLGGLYSAMGMAYPAGTL